MNYYDTWEEAAAQSKVKRAVTTTYIFHEGRNMRCEIIKAEGKDGMLNFWHSAIPIRKATTREVDTARRWKPL